MIFKAQGSRTILFNIMLIFTLIKASTSSRFLIQKHVNSDETDFYNLMSRSAKYKAVDLGAGRPDFSPPELLKNAMVNATLGHWSLSQYSFDGLPRLQRAIAKFYSKLLNRTLDPSDNVLITVGATEALSITFHTYTSPGDEWIIIEPAYSAYVSMIKAAFGVPKVVSLEPKNNGKQSSSRNWILNETELAQAFNEKTKGIVLNNPHNPTGKVFTRDELEYIADLAKKWDILVISDEVFEFATYSHDQHIRIATLPGMFKRTLTISSGTKIFPATGYRVGWAYGDAKILESLRFKHEITVMSAPTPNQEAFAVMFENEYDNFGTPKSYLYQFKNWAKQSRDRLVEILLDFGMSVVVPDSGHFLIANWTTVIHKANNEDNFVSRMDVRFIRWMIENVGVFAFPVSHFYSEYSKTVAEDCLRISFIRTEETLTETENRFKKWKSQNSVNYTVVI